VTEAHSAARPGTADGAGKRPPLDGIRVLDFSRFLSGPHCTRSLSDLGAEVVKVEPPEGDFTRQLVPRVGEFSRFYVQQNAGKRNLSIDLRHPEAPGLLERLIPDFDIIVENFRPGVMAAMGLDYERCRILNPRIVYASISGWGQDGPESTRPAFAIVIHAESGLTAQQLAQRGDQRALSDVCNHADVYAGLETVSAILAALYQREQTGTGQHLDISMMSTALAVNELVSTELDPNWRSSDITRASIFRYGAEYVALTADPVQPLSFARLSAAIGAPLTEDARFVDEESRIAHRDGLIAEIQKWMSGLGSLDQLRAALLAVQIPIGVVRGVRDVVASEWAVHRRAVVPVSDRQGGVVHIPNVPWRFSDADVRIQGGPARRGEHNAAVLAAAGLSDVEIAGLAERGVLSAESDGPELVTR